MTKEERKVYNKAYKEANKERQKIYDTKYRAGLKEKKRAKKESIIEFLTKNNKI